jgi:hypothetical protein
MSPRPLTDFVTDAGDPLGTALREFSGNGPALLYLHTAHGHRFPHDLAPYFRVFCCIRG